MRVIIGIFSPQNCIWRLIPKAEGKRIVQEALGRGRGGRGHADGAMRTSYPPLLPTQLPGSRPRTAFPTAVSSLCLNPNQVPGVN